jgi:UDP-N-acetylglucosamine 2-epimerase
MKKRILFAGFLPSHKHDIQPIITCAKDGTDWDFFTHEGSIAEQGLQALQDRGKKRKVKQVHLRYALTHSERNICEKMTKALYDMPLVRQGMEMRVDLQREAREVLLRVKPDLMVVPEDTDYLRGRLWASLAKQYQIPVCVIWPAWYNFIQIYPCIAKRIAQKWLVFGMHSKRFLISHGVDASEISCVGSLRFEQLAMQRKYLSGNAIRQQYNIMLPKNYILFVAQIRDDTEYYIRKLIAAVETVPGLSLLIKVHPDDRMESFSWLSALCRKNRDISVSKTIPFKESIYYSKAIVTLSSTAAFEALIMKKAVILLQFNHTVDEFALRGKKSPFHYAVNEDALRLVITKILKSKTCTNRIHREQFITDMFGRFDGSSPQRIVRALDDMI